MGDRIRAFDWSSTPLGPVEQWPQSLLTTVNMLLNARHPMLLFWGPHLIQFYNDGFRPSLGLDKHPKALGQPAKECWEDAWPIVGAQIETVIERGETTWNEDFLVPIDRNNRREEVYWTYGYSPVWDEAGQVAGVLVVVNETTNTVIAQRRLHTLGELAATTGQALTAADVCAKAIDVLEGNPNDVPFALIYLLDMQGKEAYLSGTIGLEPGSPLAPDRIDIEQADDELSAVWPISQVVGTGEQVRLALSEAQFGSLPSGPWPEATEEALVLPIAQAGQQRSVGVLVAGISPRRPLDEDYIRFLAFVAERIATAVSNARAYELERQRVKALADLDRAKTNFFSNISHEFRTPLTLMIGPIEELLKQEENGPEPENKKQLEIVYRNSIRLLKLVNTMLEFSRLEAGRIEAVYEPVDLAKYTAELASIFRAAIEHAGLRLVVDCPTLPEPVYVDRNMWEKIVLNLLSNAFKFTLEGEIAIRLEAIDEQACLTVRDSGVGIAPEELSLIFDRFHRIKETRGRFHEGTGIGLALVEELVKLHGGTVQVESVLNKGSRFTIMVPFGTSHLEAGRVRAAAVSVSNKKGESGAASPAQDALGWLSGSRSETDQVWTVEEQSAEKPLVSIGSEAQSQDKRPRIVWADDNADMRDYVSRLLGQRFDVVAVRDGEAALKALRTVPADLVLADVMMPKLDGLGLLRALRTDPSLKEIPIILLSARAGEESLIKGREAGADDYLIKPFSARELLARVESAINISTLRREANEALRKSEARARLAMEIAQLGSWHFDPSTDLAYFDERMCAIWGISKDSSPLTLPQLLEQIHSDDDELVSRYIATALDPHGPGHYNFEYRIIWPDRSIHWILANGQARFDGEGEDRKIATLIGTALDITVLKEAENALKEINEELEQRVAERTAELDWQNQQLRHLANQLTEVEQRERRRLAQTLHDGLQQILVAGKMQVALFANNRSEEERKQLERLFDKAIEITHSLTYELSPPVLHTSELPGALRWLADWFQKNHRFNVDVQVAPDFPVLPEHQKLFLFDAVRELIFNAVKHSGITMATVTLRKNQFGQSLVSVVDEGKGFALQKLKQDGKILEGFGLFSIRERISALGGSIQIVSKPGTGTICILIMPLPHEETQA